MNSNYENDQIVISSYINSLNPCMISRFGATEISCMVNYLSVKYPLKYIVPIILSGRTPFIWNKNILKQMHTYSGFYPVSNDHISKFCELMLSDIKYVDVLGSWLNDESFFKKELASAIKLPLASFDPFFSNNPWTSSLEGKRVLVIHPFASSISKQYSIREKIFKNPSILPEFELITIQAVQSIAGNFPDYPTWFDALDYLKSKIDECEFDVCLLGCGAYGFPLAAYVKRLGKKAVHVGGSLQLLFGIVGSRWERSVPNSDSFNYGALFNENWVRPSLRETPLSHKSVEDSCYW